MQGQEGGEGEEGEGCLEQDEWKLRQRESETPGDNLQMLQVGPFSCAHDYYMSVGPRKDCLIEHVPFELSFY